MKYKLTLTIIVLLALAASGVFLTSGDDEAGIDFATVERGRLVQEVSVTGRVEPQDEVELAFERSGTVARVARDVGDEVERGGVLVALENSERAADLESAEAQVRSEEARLEELVVGTREEDIRITEAKLAQAKLDLEDYYDDSADIVRDAFNSANKVLNDLLDPLFLDDVSKDPSLSFSTTRESARIAAEFERVNAGRSLAAIKEAHDNLPAEEGTLLEALREISEELQKIDDFLLVVNDAINAQTGLSAANLATYKNNTSQARSEISDAISSTDSHTQNISAQELAIEKIERELDLKRAGSTEQAIRAQEAVVDQARANVAKIQAQLAKTILRSPIAGVVTVQNAKVGELVSAGEIIAKVISNEPLKIEAFIPEADISLIELGDPATTTLDAYGSDEFFGARVAKVDPAETVVEGVPTYKVDLVLDDPEGLARPGMTANLDIKTAEREDTLMIPARAVVEQDGRKFVRVLEGPPDQRQFEERAVVTGLRDSFGNIEIMEGLEEGERVVTFIP